MPDRVVRACVRAEMVRRPPGALGCPRSSLDERASGTSGEAELVQAGERRQGDRLACALWCMSVDAGWWCGRNTERGQESSVLPLHRLATLSVLGSPSTAITTDENGQVWPQRLRRQWSSHRRPARSMRPPPQPSRSSIASVRHSHRPALAMLRGRCSSRSDAHAGRKQLYPRQP